MKRESQGGVSKRSGISMPPDLDAKQQSIGIEALRIHESVEFSAQSQFEQAKIWRSLNLWLGAPAAVTAALAGSTLLGAGSHNSIWGIPLAVIGGVLALIAAALSATLTTVNASRRGNQAQSSGNAYLQVQTEARQLVTIDLASLEHEDARQALEFITSSRNELNKTAEAPGARAYKRAKRNLYETHGQDYAVDGDEL